MLEAGIAFLPRLVGLAVVIEPADSRPCSVCCCLPCLRIERGNERELLGKNSTQALQIISVRSTSVHPEAQGFIPDELHNPYRFIDSGVLRLVPLKFVLVDEHLFPLPSLDIFP